MKTPFALAIGGLVSLSVLDFVQRAVGTFVLPLVGWWGVICALLLCLSFWTMRVEDQYRIRFKGAAIGLVGPVLPLLGGGYGVSTVALLYLPLVVGGLLLWRRLAALRASSLAHGGQR